MNTAHRANPIPNILTGVRLFAGVVMFLILAGATSGFPFADQWMSPDDQFALYRTGFWIFVIAASTDWFDGWLARRWNATSSWGAILDPIADKVLTTGAILGVLTSGSVPQIIIPCGLILFREFAVSALRETMAGRIELAGHPGRQVEDDAADGWPWAASCSPATGTASACRSNIWTSSSSSPTC